VVENLNLQELPFSPGPPLAPSCGLEPKVNRNDIWKGCVSSYDRVLQAKSLRISTRCELLSQWPYQWQLVVIPQSSFYQ
jgi:hypothetical protein